MHHTNIHGEKQIINFLFFCTKSFDVWFCVSFPEENSVTNQAEILDTQVQKFSCLKVVPRWCREKWCNRSRSGKPALLTVGSESSTAITAHPRNIYDMLYLLSVAFLATPVFTLCKTGATG